MAKRLVESSLQRSVTFPFFPSISPNHAEKKKRSTTVDSQTQFDILRIEFRLTLNLGEIGKVAKKSVDPYK